MVFKTTEEKIVFEGSYDECTQYWNNLPSTGLLNWTVAWEDGAPPYQETCAIEKIPTMEFLGHAKCFGYYNCPIYRKIATGEILVGAKGVGNNWKEGAFRNLSKDYPYMVAEVITQVQ